MMFHNMIPRFDVPTYSIHVDRGAHTLWRRRRRRGGEEDEDEEKEEAEAEAEAEAEMGEAEVEEAEMGEAWQRVTKKSKFEMTFNELHSYYESKLRQVGKCPNRGWNCLAILSDGGVHASVVMYVLVQQKDKVQTRCARF